MAQTVSITVNGLAYVRDVEPRLLLTHFLRDVIGLTGTNVGCDTSQCGACTVLMDGVAVKSCTVLAVQADGSSITTIEGLASDGTLHPVQNAFWEKHGLQCGFCTPGMIMAATKLVENKPGISEAEIRHGLEGNFCRCTGYQNIVNAVAQAAAGFPIVPVAPCEGTGYEIGSMSIIAGARNEEEAKRFYDWALSADVQSRAQTVNSFQLPSNKSATQSPLAPDLSQIKLIDYDFAKYGSSDERKRLLSKWDTEVSALPQ